jgi:glycosyltransferase involved in cell wall biosynthesis
MPYKRVDLAIEACNRLRLPLVVVGDGPARAELERLAGPTVRFAGRLSDAETRACYTRCTALVFAGQDDFGLAPIEAQAAGRPVIAYARGGVLESVEDGIGGVLFEPQTADGLVDAIRRFQRLQFQPRDLRRGAERFDVSEFRARLTRLVLGA